MGFTTLGPASPSLRCTEGSPGAASTDLGWWLCRRRSPSSSERGGFFSLFIGKAEVRMPGRECGLFSGSQMVRGVSCPGEHAQSALRSCPPGQQFPWLLRGLRSWKALASKMLLRAEPLPAGLSGGAFPSDGSSGRSQSANHRLLRGPYHLPGGPRASGPGHLQTSCGPRGPSH